MQSRGADAAFLVFSGYNQRAVIAFLRVLERHGIEYGIVAAGQDDSILLSAYRQRVIEVRSSTVLEMDFMAKTIAGAANRFSDRALILAPSTEALNRFALVNRTAFEANGIAVPLVDLELYERISDKRPFGALCQAHGIRIPDEFGNPATLPLPFVAKPRSYGLAPGLRPMLIKSESDRRAFLADRDATAFYFQEFVDGRSLYLLLHIAADGGVLSFSQENLIQQPGGKSIVAAVAADFHRSTEAARYVRMLKNVGFRGLVMVEVRQHGDDYYMIEANPRFWGPSQLFVDAMEVDLFDAFLSDQGFQLIGPKARRGERYFWHGGLIEARMGGAEPAVHNYSIDQFDRDLPAWLAADVYRRPDTMAIYSAEVAGSWP
jgi:hypothetical protein